MSESQQLFKKYINNQCSTEELEALMAYFHTYEYEKLSLLVLQELEQPESYAEEENNQTLLSDVYSNIQYKIQLNRKSVRSLWPKIAAVASLFLILSFGGYLLIQHQKVRSVGQKQQIDIAPGGNKAMLTLSNGQQIVLNNVNNVRVAKQGNTIINKNSSGQIVYIHDEKGQRTELAYNTMTTPRGGKYEITLSDGTQVTLDAASSIHYPVSFSGKERKVEITGEAYFEVAHNKSKPFLVTTKGQTVEVLGTHFNINAYDDEPVIKTTLLEGKIKISKEDKAALLTPGQQAKISSTGNIQVISGVDIEEAVAWKNGFFQFNNADLLTVMRQLSRWYNVDIAFDGDVPKRTFSGKIHRNLNASEALQMLQYFKVNYKITDKKIFISK